MASSALSLQSVCVSYGDKEAVRDVSVDVSSGEIFGLIGLNGAGKTTIIKSILELRDLNSGEISVFGQSKKDLSHKKIISYLPEKFEPPWFLTGVEFLKFSLSLYNQRFDKSEIVKVATDLDLATDALDRRMSTYSKGMKQKLGIMATLLTGSKLFILDEPMSGLDPKARSLVKVMINRMRSEGRTVFFSSHVLADMDEICDRVAILHGGRIKFIDTPDALKRVTNSNNLESAFLDYIEN